MAIETTGSTGIVTYDLGTSDITQEHPEYQLHVDDWERVRDSIAGERAIKEKKTKYLPQPEGMKGEFDFAYTDYITRAHFPLICNYALQGALGVIITKRPEFKVPKALEYILKEATKDGRTISQLFLDVIIEIFKTGRVPLAVDITPDNKFKFIQYKAEELINWGKSDNTSPEKDILYTVFKGSEPDTTDRYSHATKPIYTSLELNESSEYVVRTYTQGSNYGIGEEITPEYMGSRLSRIPVVVAGSISNGIDTQPIPLIPVANCSVQIYRKEADLANSEFLSCNPTLIGVGVDTEERTNVVGSSVFATFENDQARVFYTTTDTKALTHVKSHILDLYNEGIRHGVSILDSQGGAESAEALRIRQATQSASLYSIYNSAVEAIETCLKIMCEWAGLDDSDVSVDSPASLVFGVPDSSVLKEIISGFAESGVVPIQVVHKYLVSSGLLEQTISFDDYIKLIEENSKLRKQLGLSVPNDTKEPQVNENVNVEEVIEADTSDTE